MPHAPVRIERSGDVGVILIDSPPVNALSHAVREGLLGAVGRIAEDPHLRAAVIACEGRTFVAGADIREFDAAPRSPSLHEVIAAIEFSPKPVVAALHGTALGGGLELALGCHARVIAPDGRVGLPEVRIGLIPGAGGTQRVPRLAGPVAALDIATSGRHVPAGEALALGLVDAVSQTPREEAVLRARALADAGQWRRSSELAVPEFDRAAFDAQAQQVRRRARGAEAPGRVIESIENALTLPFKEGSAREVAIFAALRHSSQARALRHLFLAERAAARTPAGAMPMDVARAGVVGGGTMGSGIAVAMLDAGLQVTLAEVSDAARDAAEKRVRAVYDRQVKSGRLSPEAREARLGRIGFATELTDLAGVDLVVEAVIEEMPTKQDVFRRLSSVLRRDAVIASNTSYLDINRMADAVEGPERVLGLHFFSPAHVMRLLEVVRAERTSPDVLATGIALGKRLKKLPVVAGVCDGFIGNRILARWRVQTDYMLEDGATPQEIDAALEAYGFAMGPYAVADLAGLDIGWATRKRKAATRDPNERYVPVADWICERGRFGQKTGAGYYRYEDGKRVVDPEVTALVEKASEQRGIARRKIAPEDIQNRVHASMVNEACKVLAEGVADRPSDIDLVLVNGYGYPAWRGGPMFGADEIGLAEMLRRVEAIHAECGAGWEPASLLRELARDGKRFADLNAG